MESDRTLRAMRRDAVREQREAQTRRELLVLQRKSRARLMHSGIMARDQCIGRILPATGRTVRLLYGRISTPTWSTLFINMLTHMLSGKDFWADIEITMDYPDVDSPYNIIIGSRRERVGQEAPGATQGMMQIVVKDNEPRRGFSTDASNEDDWSRRSCLMCRETRMEFYPFREITHLIVPVKTDFGRISKFRDFPSWDHAVYKGGGYNDKYVLYHSDFNVSYPAMKIIAEFITEHYRLAELEFNADDFHG
jgi:hypothetical protein